MGYNFKGKTVVITGASSGIGKEMTSRLINKFGCTVYAIARREGLLNELRQELGDRLIPCPFDASVKENWTSFAARLNDEGVIVDTLINCAGVLPKFSSVENMDSAAVSEAMNINFFAQVYATEAMLPIVKKSTQGGIISFASSSALCPFAGVSAYCASKSASRMYFECLARENRKIYVSTVMNGFVKTDIMKNQGASEKDTKLFSRVCADLNKTVRRIMRKIRWKRVRIVVGLDAHLMNFLYKCFPNAGPRLVSRILKKSGLEIFSQI